MDVTELSKLMSQLYSVDSLHQIERRLQQLLTKATVVQSLLDSSTRPTFDLPITHERLNELSQDNDVSKIQIIELMYKDKPDEKEL